MPFKLVRFITQSRKKRNHWENTQANMFCMKGLIDFARQTENQFPDYGLSILFDRSIEDYFAADFVWGLVRHVSGVLLACKF